MTNGEYQQLVEFLGRQFTAIDRRFDAIDQRLDAMDRRFDLIDERLDAIDRRFVAIDERFDAIDRRFVAIDERFDAIDQRFLAIDRALGTLERRFVVLEHRVEDGFREVVGHLDTIYGRLERLEQEYQAIVAGLRRIEALLADEIGRRELVERGLAELRERIALLQARLDEVERRLRE
jgi:chromosome segregation ATPase